MVTAAISVQKVLSTYGQQKFYANRAQQSNLPKTYQIGAQDKVTISSDAITKNTSAQPATQPTAAAASVVAATEPPHIDGQTV